MEKLLLELSLTQDDVIEVKATHSGGEAISNTHNIQTGEKNDFYQKLKAHKSTLLKALDLGIFNEDTFSAEEHQWLIESKLLDSSGPHFIGLQKYVGQNLYNALFHFNDQVKDALSISRSNATRQKQRLHIQLHIHAHDKWTAQLLDYPWELLHDGKDFLFKHLIIISRYIAYNEQAPILSIAQKLRVLLIYHKDAYDETLGLEKISSEEYDQIYHRLKGQTDIELFTLAPSSFAEFCEQLHIIRPHVIHFHGHGFFGKQCTACKQMYNIMQQQCEHCAKQLGDHQGYLLFTGNSKKDYVSANRFSIEIKNLSIREASAKSDLALVVLSACRSGLSLAKTGSENVSIFNGLAQSLIQAGAPAVVGMQFNIRVDKAADFAMRFYSRLQKRAPLFDAMAHGILGMDIEDDQWYRPVLYTRWQGNNAGQLFTSIAAEKEISFLTTPTPIKQTTTIPSSHTEFQLSFNATTYTYSEHIKQLFAQIEKNLYLLINAESVFNSGSIWSDNCFIELEHLQNFRKMVKEFINWIDHADIGTLTEQENKHRNMILQPAHAYTETLDKLIQQVSDLYSYLMNHSSVKPDSLSEICVKFQRLEVLNKEINTYIKNELS